MEPTCVDGFADTVIRQTFDGHHDSGPDSVHPISVCAKEDFARDKCRAFDAVDKTVLSEQAGSAGGGKLHQIRLAVGEHLVRSRQGGLDHAFVPNAGEPP